MSPAARIAALLGSPVTRLRAVSGGEICRAYAVELADGRRLFAKQAPPGAGAMMAVEAAGLAWLADGGASVPQVVAGEDDLLVLSWVDGGRADPEAAHGFGQALALLHRSGAKSFGAAPPGVRGPGWIGSAGMSFGDDGDWPAFFAEHRIWPYLRAARAAGHLTTAEYDSIARVCDCIAQLAGPAVPPARLHGDLWHGNLLWASHGAVLIDPAAHGGHPESDLAMLTLFPPDWVREILAGYRSVSPLPDGWAGRIALHRLFPLLVHAELFGGPYGAAAATQARSLVAGRGR